MTSHEDEIDVKYGATIAKKMNKQQAFNLNYMAQLRIDNSILHGTIHGSPAFSQSPPSFTQLSSAHSQTLHSTEAICSRELLSRINRSRSSPIKLVRWYANGRRLFATSSNGELNIWNCNSSKIEDIKQFHSDAISALEFSNREQIFLSGDTSGNIKFFSKDLAYMKEIKVSSSAITSLSFCGGDGRFAVCTAENPVRVYSTATGVEELSLPRSTVESLCCSWHPWASLLALGGKNHSIQLYDPRRGTELFNAFYHRQSVSRVKFDSTGNYLYSAGKDHVIKQYDLRTMKTVSVLTGHSTEVTDLALHPIHPNILMSSDSHGDILCWNMNDGRTATSRDIEADSVLRYPATAIHNAHASAVNSLAWHVNGHIIASGGEDCMIKFWYKGHPTDSMEDITRNPFATAAGFTAPKVENVSSFKACLLANEDIILNLSSSSSSNTKSIPTSLHALKEGNGATRNATAQIVNASGPNSGATTIVTPYELEGIRKDLLEKKQVTKDDSYVSIPIASSCINYVKKSKTTPVLPASSQVVPLLKSWKVKNHPVDKECSKKKLFERLSASDVLSTKQQGGSELSKHFNDLFGNLEEEEEKNKEYKNSGQKAEAIAEDMYRNINMDSLINTFA